MGMLPSGTLTLLLADVEGSTRLWREREPEMPAEWARLDAIVSYAVNRHGGTRPIEQGEGDSFVVSFIRPMQWRARWTSSGHFATVMSICASGSTQARSQRALGTGPRALWDRRTVTTHLSHVFAKLGIRSRSELAVKATKHGL